VAQPILIRNGYRGLRGVEQMGRQAEHSLPSNDDVKNPWSYTSILSCVRVTIERVWIGNWIY
jgi:hypothetical protein